MAAPTDAAAAACDADIEAFLHAHSTWSAHTLAAYRRDLRQFARAQIEAGHTDWSTIDQHAVRPTSPRDTAPAAAAARSRASCRPARPVRHLVEQGRLPRNPARQVRAPRGEKRLPRALDVDEMAALLAPVAGATGELVERDRAMWELLYSSGLRVAELTALDVGDVDRVGGEVRVRGKGRKERVVPVGRRALEALAAWLPYRAARVRPGEPALFVNRHGGRLGTRSVRLRLRDWARRRGIAGNVHPHMLRHSFASHVLESSGDRAPCRNSSACRHRHHAGLHAPRFPAPGPRL